MTSTTRADRTPLTARRRLIYVGGTTFLFALPWQFAPLVLLTQLAALFATHLLGYLPPARLRAIVAALLLGVGAVCTLQFGNTFLVTSPFTAAALAVLATLFLQLPLLAGLQRRPWAWCAATAAIAAIAFAAISLLLRALAGRAAPDAHIWQILRAKLLSDGPLDFDASLYTCAPEFDFMAAEYLSLSKTLLLPTAAAVMLGISVHIVGDLRRRSLPATCSDGQTGGGAVDGVPPGPAAAPEAVMRGDPEGETSGDLVYLLLQVLAFLIMAALVMRLKLLLSTGLILTASLVLHPGLAAAFLRAVGARSTAARATHLLLVALLLGGMSLQGLRNVASSLTSENEFNDPAMEEMLLFARSVKGPSADAVPAFAGSMSVTAAVQCVAGQHVVNHPHYEHARNRAVTKQVRHHPCMTPHPLHTRAHRRSPIGSCNCTARAVATCARHGCDAATLAAACASLGWGSLRVVAGCGRVFVGSSARCVG